jgi:hypothetical protein
VLEALDLRADAWSWIVARCGLRLRLRLSSGRGAGSATGAAGRRDASLESALSLPAASTAATRLEVLLSVGEPEVGVADATGVASLV